MNFDLARFAATAFVIFFAIGLHEYAHCKVADMAGDPTPGIYGRVTLDLRKHFDPLGTIMMFITSLTGYGIGWGKPAPINPAKMGNPRWDALAAVAAGPISNILQAIIYAVPLRYMYASGALNDPGPDGPPFLFLLLSTGVRINLALAFFNLIPLGPLDGHWIVGQLLPEKPRHYWYRFNRGAPGSIGIGTAILMVLIFGSQFLEHSIGFSPLWIMVGQPITYMFRLLTGRPIG